MNSRDEALATLIFDEAERLAKEFANNFGVDEQEAREVAYLCVGGKIGEKRLAEWEAEYQK